MAHPSHQHGSFAENKILILVLEWIPLFIFTLKDSLQNLGAMSNSQCTCASFTCAKTRTLLTVLYYQQQLCKSHNQ